MHFPGSYLQLPQSISVGSLQLLFLVVETADEETAKRECVNSGGCLALRNVQCDPVVFATAAPIIPPGC